MKYYSSLLLVVAYFLVLVSTLNGQRYLLLETINDPENIKIEEGAVLTYKVKGADDWLTGRIEKFMVPENTILFEDALVSLESITAVLRYRKGVDYASKTLMTFGAGWLVFGALGQLAGGGDLTTGNVIIGGTSIVTGWLLRKLFFKRKHEMGKRYRLRLVDLSLE